MGSIKEFFVNACRTAVILGNIIFNVFHEIVESFGTVELSEHGIISRRIRRARTRLQSKERSRAISLVVFATAL